MRVISPTNINVFRFGWDQASVPPSLVMSFANSASGATATRLEFGDALAAEEGIMKLTSSAFEHEGVIPDKYSKEGGNISPPLAWTDVPPGTRSLALIVDDSDAPSGLFVHWLVCGIRPAATGLEEGMPATATLPDGAMQGRNGFGDLGYGGPRPPSGTHRYFFHLYALDRQPDLAPGADRKQVDEAIQGHVLAEAQLMGRYQHRGARRGAA